MTDLTTSHAQHVDRTSTDVPRTPVPFRRLLAVETRKLFDTRSSKLMTALLLAMTVVSIAGRGAVDGPQLLTLIATAGIGLGTLLPVLGILTVTSEWQHRTALTTFVLEPRRGRVLVAKCLPPLLAAVAASLLAMLVAVLVTAAVSGLQGVPANWEVTLAVLLGWSATNVLVVAMGLAVGMLLLNAPAAIVICLSTTILWNVARQLGSAGEALAGWLDLGTTTVPLMAGELTGGDAARLAVSVVFWIAVPMVAGVLRVVRKEVS